MQGKLFQQIFFLFPGCRCTLISITFNRPLCHSVPTTHKVMNMLTIV
uniref:Uncharacterized protein n=1 Tax=Anguilla anguilla TaxID=7936 RepID=A0A0E9WTH6_ANGAN